MDRAFGRSLSSPLVTFTVGADKKEIPVHSSALAQLSQSLDALINGEMIEAKTKQVDWSEVDVDTFARLCEFAYRRNYISPSFRLIDLNSYPFSPVNGKSLHSNVGGDEATPEPTTFQYDGNSLPEMPYKERSISTRQLHNTFTQIPVNVFQSNPSSYSTSTSKTSTNTKPSQDFTPVFLGYAHLYVLADKYGIEPLCQLTISKLEQTLKTFKLYDTGVSGIVELVRFVYLNTPPNFGSKVDALRNLATRYVASVLGQIGDNKDFQELLEEGGPFVSDL